MDVAGPLWPDLPEYRGLTDGLKKGTRETLVHGLPTPAAVALLATLASDTGRPLCVLTPDWAQAESYADQLTAWLGQDRVACLPPRDVLPYAMVAQSTDLAARRVTALRRAMGREQEGGSPVLVLPVASMRRLLAPPDVFAAACLDLREGGRLTPREMASALARAGYEPLPLVEGPGVFALRGGIVDVFPLGDDLPLRVEFFDDQIESMRRFDPSSQRSREACPRALVLPAREVPAPEEPQLAEAIARIASAGEQAGGRLVGEARQRLQDMILDDLAGLQAGTAAGRWETYLPFAYAPAHPLTYMPERTLVAICEPARTAEAARDYERAEADRLIGFLQDGRMLPEQVEAFAFPPDWLLWMRQRQILYVQGLGQAIPGADPQDVLAVSAREVPSFRGQWEMAAEELRRWRDQRYHILCTAGNAARATRLAEEVGAAGVTAAVDAEPAPGRATVGVAPLMAGFEFPGLRLVVLTEADLFGRRTRPTRRAPATQPAGSRLLSYEDLQVGDYVVHVQHGIGQYLGTKTLTVQGAQRDYLMIRYEGADRLYVPTDQIDLIQKYIGGEGREVRVGRLGGDAWLKAKARVKESVRAMAEELIELYAAREGTPGHAFPPDTPWQLEFEDAFPFEETPDQLQATAEIKADMERARPMERLLCGDVGYGKTEVAMRAAFKCVMDGRQVAVLVPTTILAEQHFLTFTERMRGFPVTVQMLSRFRDRKEQEATVTGLRRGAVDIVIGTHRLLQSDIDFSKLGLLVVDEEHRFGVADKERIKRMRQGVDSLSMTATPIPRTLHMAMAGVRDMSVIETPPENRFPVETYVLELSDALCADALQRELRRKGQVFYLHNRVQTIARALERLRGLAPGARVAVAHGQMAEDELERVMVEFWHGAYDVLVCTTIMESGLDVPNANTLIVEDADRLGLAQLYQIRGRVGRSDRLAYAYFTYRREKALSEIAEKRLLAIKEFTELGSGFKIALRDLELRGAGNILGAEQHGFVAAVGFDLYAQMLEESVRELRGERTVPTTRTSVEIRVDAYLPDSYIPDARVKLDFYKKVNAAATLQDVAAAQTEIRDRYGPYPPEVEHLLRLARIRIAGQELSVLSIAHEGDSVLVTFPGYMADLIGQLDDLTRRFGRRIASQRRPRPALTLRLSARDDTTVLGEIDGLLADLGSAPAIQRWRRMLDASPA
ncbi:MAG TPA: transcription-repair coupling factor [Bacillota bacterium]|nr:transcription-repair coupling factor [Bacillota bacterium]